MKKIVFVLSALMATQAFANVLDDCKKSPTIETCTQAVKESNDAFYQTNLAFSYYNGKNYVEAAKWFRKAAEQGYADAQLI